MTSGGIRLDVDRRVEGKVDLLFLVETVGGFKKRNTQLRCPWYL